MAGSWTARLLASGAEEVAFLCIRGDVDLSSAAPLRDLLRRILERKEVSLVLDLSEVAFMDSTGVHLVVEADRRLKSQNRRLTIACREHGQVHRLFALVGLLDLLSVHYGRKSALRAARAT